MDRIIFALAVALPLVFAAGYGTALMTPNSPLAHPGPRVADTSSPTPISISQAGPPWCNPGSHPCGPSVTPIVPEMPPPTLLLSGLVALTVMGWRRRRDGL